MNSFFSMAHLGNFVNYLTGAAAIVAALNPALLGPYGVAIAAGAGVVVSLAHHSYNAGSTAAVLGAMAKAATNVPVKLVLAALMLGSLVGVGTLSGCTTLPTPSQDAAVTAAVTIATGLAIQQHDTADSGKWQARAKEIKLIALELKQVNDAGSATLETLAKDLQPQIQRLGPADVLAVNALVATLGPILQDQISRNPKVGNTQIAVDTILTAVLTVCSAYGV